MMEISKSGIVDKMMKDYHEDKKFMDRAFQLDDQGMGIITPDGHCYGICRERINTHKKILDWLGHLLEKPWFRQDARYTIGFLSRAKIFLDSGRTD